MSAIPPRPASGPANPCSSRSTPWVTRRRPGACRTRCNSTSSNRGWLDGRGRPRRLARARADRAGGGRHPGTRLPATPGIPHVHVLRVPRDLPVERGRGGPDTAFTPLDAGPVVGASWDDAAGVTESDGGGDRIDHGSPRLENQALALERWPGRPRLPRDGVARPAGESWFLRRRGRCLAPRWPGRHDTRSARRYQALASSVRRSLGSPWSLTLVPLMWLSIFGRHRQIAYRGDWVRADSSIGVGRAFSWRS